MQNNTIKNINNRLTPTQIYSVIENMEGFKESDETFSSTGRVQVEKFVGSTEQIDDKSQDDSHDFEEVSNGQNGQPKPLQISYFVQKDKFIITTPAHDSIDDQASDAQKISEVLDKVKDKLENGGKILVPICQENKILGLFRKGHFTMLEISKDAQGQVSAIHHDSKGFLSKIMYFLGLYSLEPIRNAVSASFHGANFSNQCHGHQGLRDDVNCGRFVLGYIDQKVENPNQVLTDPSLNNGLQAIENKINNLQQAEVQPQIANGGNGEAGSQEQDARYKNYINNSKNSQGVDEQGLGQN